MILYQVWGPDGLPISPDLYPTADIAARVAAQFVASYQRQGYYRDNRGQHLTLPELADYIRVEELDARMTPEKAYVTYIQENLERISANWQPVCYAEFLESEECMNLMDLCADEDEES